MFAPEDVEVETRPTTAPTARSRRSNASDSQGARKRELDRIAQRASRERAKNRILDLEEKLERLQADDKQKQISDLMRVIEDLRNENERLRKILGRIGALAHNDVDGRGSDRSVNQSSTPPTSDDGKEPLPAQDASGMLCEPWWVDGEDVAAVVDSQGPDNIFPLASFVEDPQAYFGTSPSTEALVQYFPYHPGPFSMSKAFSASLNSWPQSITPSTRVRYPPSTVVVDEEKWYVSNDALVKGISAMKKCIGESEIVDSHAPFKAIVLGWDVMEDRQRLHPMWKALRQMDEMVFGNWQSKAQKIAMMFVCHRMLLYQANPCKETMERVPTFLRPRPSQELIQHPPVIDFLIWPGLRDRLVFSHEKYTATGDFSRAFCKYLRFFWPFSDHDILNFDPVTQTHKLSPLFEEYAFDAQNWTMNEGFFVNYAEMKHDIPASHF